MIAMQRSMTFSLNEQLTLHLFLISVRRRMKCRAIDFDREIEAHINKKYKENEAWQRYSFRELHYMFLWRLE